MASHRLAYLLAVLGMFVVAAQGLIAATSQNRQSPILLDTRPSTVPALADSERENILKDIRDIGKSAIEKISIIDRFEFRNAKHPDITNALGKILCLQVPFREVKSSPEQLLQWDPSEEWLRVRCAELLGLWAASGDDNALSFLYSAIAKPLQRPSIMRALVKAILDARGVEHIVAELGRSLRHEEGALLPSISTEPSSKSRYALDVIWSFVGERERPYHSPTQKAFRTICEDELSKCLSYLRSRSDTEWRISIQDAGRTLLNWLAYSAKYKQQCADLFFELSKKTPESKAVLVGHLVETHPYGIEPPNVCTSAFVRLSEDAIRQLAAISNLSLRQEQNLADLLSVLCLGADAKGSAPIDVITQSLAILRSPSTAELFLLKPNATPENTTIRNAKFFDMAMAYCVAPTDGPQNALRELLLQIASNSTISIRFRTEAARYLTQSLLQERGQIDETKKKVELALGLILQDTPVKQDDLSFFAWPEIAAFQFCLQPAVERTHVLPTLRTRLGGSPVLYAFFLRMAAPHVNAFEQPELARLLATDVVACYKQAYLSPDSTPMKKRTLNLCIGARQRLSPEPLRGEAPLDFGVERLPTGLTPYVSPNHWDDWLNRYTKLTEQMSRNKQAERAKEASTQPEHE